MASRGYGARGTGRPARTGVRAGRTRGRARRPTGRTARRARGRRAAGARLRSAEQGARSRLRNFRQATALAVAITGLLLMLLAPAEAGGVQEAQQPDPAAADTVGALAELPDTVAVIEPIATESLRAALVDTAPAAAAPDAGESAEEATGALRELWEGFVGNLPKYAIALGILAVAWLISWALQWGFRRASRHWQRGNAFAAMARIVVWLLALGIAASILVGDIRALVGSLGLIGLALSWALQTPIESFTGWLLNSFHGHYRVGDRIAVGEVFGDVYRINLLTTTVWEYGGADRPPGSVQAEQPTGRLITFPNNEVLTGSIVNYTRDFAYVWDEAVFTVANESELRYAMQVLEQVARRVVGPQMAEPARAYEQVLRREGLANEIPTEPQLFVALGDSWTEITVRYLVGAREKRRWKSALTLAVVEELNREEHRGRILGVYPRRQLQWVGPDGQAREPLSSEPPAE